MMNNTPFYHSSIRNLTAAFGSLFSNVQIQRIGADNTTVEKVIRVPLAYAAGNKTVTLLQQQNEPRQQNSNDIKISLPRLAFELTGVSYDSSRKTQTLTQTLYQSVGASGVSRNRQYVPVPYNFEYTLSLYVKYIDDGLQVIEQILPYFRPHYTVTLNDIPSLEISRDVPIYITSVTQENLFEGSPIDDQIITWSLTFIANGWIYPPIATSKIIKVAHTNIFDLDNEQRLFGTTCSVDPASADVTDTWTINVTKD